jgi:hypothetical protein
MAYFQTKNPDLGKFWRVLQWKMLPFGLFYGYLVYFVAIWYMHFMAIWCIFPRFGMLYQEKSDNPGSTAFKVLVLQCRHREVLVNIRRSVPCFRGTIFLSNAYTQ